MQRTLNIFSTVLSWLAAVSAALVASFTIYLEGRATWSGEAAPQTWAAGAKADDVFSIAGRDIAYWGDPEAVYSKYATRKRRPPVAIVVHHTTAKPVQNLVSYGHMSDPNRGGASFGYHFYVGRNGLIVQGAPLSRRTNHIKFSTNAQRRETARHLWSGNTIAVSLVGGCDALLRPRFGQWGECSDEFATGAQLAAGLAVIQALQTRFELRCEEVYGHGDLQFDRQSFEGVQLSRLAREACVGAPEIAELPLSPVEVAGEPEAVAVGDTTAARSAAKASQPSGS